MVQGEQDGDDLAVNLSWPSGPTAVRRPPPGATAPPDEATPAPGPDLLPPAEGPPARSLAPPGAAAPPARTPAPAGPAVPRPASAPVNRADPPEEPWAAAAPAAPPARRPRPREAVTSNGAIPNETLLSVLDHLNTLSQLVTGTSRATSAELADLAGRVDRAVADLDALQQRVVRSLAGFDALRLRVQKELADRPPLTEDDIERIAQSVTHRLLDQVRVETEPDGP